MPTFRATDPSGVVVEYDATAPHSEHLGADWHLEELVKIDPVIDVPTEPAAMYGGRRRLTKLEFIDLLGDAAYTAILVMQKRSVQVEAWVKKLELATPDANGASVDLDSQRVHDGVKTLGKLLEAEGIVGEDWVERVLNG